MKRVKLRVKIGNEPNVIHHETKAYMTDLAGVVLHPSLGVERGTNRVFQRRREWNITQYPTGLRIFGPFRTMEDALTTINKFMRPYNWVGLNAEDIIGSNGREEMNNLATQVKDYMAKMRQK
jgi:hypothetical protein